MVITVALLSDGTWGVIAGSARQWFADSPARLRPLTTGGGVVMIGLGVRLDIELLIGRTCVHGLRDTLSTGHAHRQGGSTSTGSGGIGDFDAGIGSPRMMASEAARSRRASARNGSAPALIAADTTYAVP